MKFSTKTTYGIRALIKLAKNSPSGPVSVAQIAKDEKLSSAYLERIFSALKKAGIVKSEKGANGGYILAKPDRQVDLLEIVVALEGKTNSFSCPVSIGKSKTCQPNCGCAADYSLNLIQTKLDEVLRNINIGQLKSEQK